MRRLVIVTKVDDYMGWIISMTQASSTMICFATRETLVHNILTVITLFTNYKLTTSYSIPLYCKYNKIVFAKRVTLFMHRKTHLRIYGAVSRELPNKLDLSLEQSIWRLCGNEHSYSDWHIILRCKGHCFDFEAIRNLWNFYRNRQSNQEKN